MLPVAAATYGVKEIKTKKIPNVNLFKEVSP